MNKTKTNALNVRRVTITCDNEDLEPISCPFCDTSMITWKKRNFR